MSKPPRLWTDVSIGSQPRFRLAALPTPLQELSNLRLKLGGKAHSPRILMKRDDLTGLGNWNFWWAMRYVSARRSW
jgi:hypothetical protein